MPISAEQANISNFSAKLYFLYFISQRYYLKLKKNTPNLSGNKLSLIQSIKALKLFILLLNE